MYDAQLVLLLSASDTVEDAQISVDEWLDPTEEHYTITDTARQIMEDFLEHCHYAAE